MDDSYHFKTTLEKFDSKLWTYHIKVPAAIAETFIAQDAKRVVCTLNGRESFQCAIMPKGEGIFFINVNKKLRDALGLKVGSRVDAAIKADASEFGLPMPEELGEVLRQDEDARGYFEALTPGKQRNLLYIAGAVKSPELRLHRALVVAEHLKENKGKIDFKQLYAALKPQP